MTAWSSIQRLVATLDAIHMGLFLLFVAKYTGGGMLLLARQLLNY